MASRALISSLLTFLGTMTVLSGECLRRGYSSKAKYIAFLEMLINHTDNWHIPQEGCRYRITKRSIRPRPGSLLLGSILLFRISVVYIFMLGVFIGSLLRKE